MFFTDFNVGNGPDQGVKPEHALEFQFALPKWLIWFKFFLADKWQFKIWFINHMYNYVLISAVSKIF